jgi:adenylyl-sulfate kinase
MTLESPSAGQAPTNIIWHAGRVSREDRWRALGNKGGTVWFTGLSGSGKSTLAAAVEQRLIGDGRSAYRLDGDNLRSGLNADLDFSRSGREENIRRVAEVACLFGDSGAIALVALISPYRAARQRARELHAEHGLAFVEVHMAAPLDVCATRDPKGLYALVSEGEIPSFTGVDDPYEEPDAAELELSPDVELDKAIEQVVRSLDESIRARADADSGTS